MLPLVTLASLPILWGWWWGKCHSPSELVPVRCGHIYGHSTLTKQCSIHVAGLKGESGARHHCHISKIPGFRLLWQHDHPKFKAGMRPCLRGQREKEEKEEEGGEKEGEKRRGIKEGWDREEGGKETHKHM